MKLRFISICCATLLISSIAFAQTKIVDNPDRNDLLDRIMNETRVKNVIDSYEAQNESRFQEHMEITRISSPSRQEYYRAKELYDRLKAFNFDDDPTKYEIIFTGVSGIMPGAAVQQVDGRKVYQTCAVVKGITGAIDPTNEYSRPKVVIEGHIDTVFPSAIPGFNPTEGQTAWHYEPVKIQPISEPIVLSPQELAAIDYELKFDPNTGKINTSDPSYADAIKRTNEFRLYVPGYSDAMNNTTSVYHLAKLFKQNNIVPVHDIWFCFTAGEEGRGNLAGMKQLYGYNQDAPQGTPLAEKGKNRLNIVANMSIDGGGGTIHYLGSYRYEVNYKGTGAAMAVAKSIAGIADLKSPSEDGTSNQKTTYTVGILYPLEDGSYSYEIDMRSPTPDVLDIMYDRIKPWFEEGATLQNKVKGSDVVMTLPWFGDRPAHTRSDDLIKTDPLIYYSYRSNPTLDLATWPVAPSSSSSSLNDNVPGAMNIPSVNLNIGVTQSGGGGHTFYEFGNRGDLAREMNNVKRVVYTLIAIAGLTDGSNNKLIDAAYDDEAPRYVNDVWDTEDIWN